MNYDAWKLASPDDEREAAERRRLAREAEEAMEDAEWDALGETDLLSAEELKDLARKPTDLSNNQFSDA